MRALLAVPPVEDAYPFQAICLGLQRIGIQWTTDRSADADILVTWSPWNGSLRKTLANCFSARGKPVIVLENGWLNPHPLAGPMYQCALDGWNGTGRFPSGHDGGARWRSFSLPMAPWVSPARPGHVLVIGQKGGPDDDRTATPDWHERLALPGAVIRRPARSSRPLVADLASASEVHVWTSNAAAWALLLGVPVVQHGPNLMVCELASRPGRPLLQGVRESVFARLAWAQWTADELAAGEPFHRLLHGVSA